MIGKILLITHALASDRAARRKAMMILVGVSLGMVFVGSTLLWPLFESQPLVFAIYWLVCVWVVLTAALLAVYDMLREIRDARRDRDREKKRIFNDFR